MRVHRRGWTLAEPNHANAKHEPAFLCKITVTQVFDKRGRPIIRYNGGKKKPTPQPDGGK
jgi:hypothetical protein